jgi:membrane protease YdiL (CAAX protease family)
MDTSNAIAPGADSFPPASERPRRRGNAVVAWIVIALVVVAIIGGRFAWEYLVPLVAEEKAAPMQMTLLELQSRYLVGAHNLLGPLMPGLDQEVAKMNQGGVAHRLRAIVVIGEIDQPAEAKKHLDRLENARNRGVATFTDEEARIADILKRLYGDLDAGDHGMPSVTENERAYLVEKLGWFGTLALNPRPRLPRAMDEVKPLAGAAAALAVNVPDEPEGRAEALRPAYSSFLAIIIATLLGVFAVCVGFCGLILMAVLGWSDALKWRFLPPGDTHGAVYAETFALWLVCFFGWNAALSVLPIDLPRLAQAMVVMLSSLSVLAWPIARGIPWRQVRDDIGLTCGNPFVEILAGVWCYIVNLPIVAVGLLMTVGTMMLKAYLEGSGGEEDFSAPSVPSHPIVHVLAAGDWLDRLQIFFLASVVAPIVEEIMFRGVLHRHMRKATGWMRPITSALLSTTGASFIFAAIHPQGLMTIPPLMFMAFGFSLAREWRGSLLPSMFAHGLSNGIVLIVATIALSK